jgi:hypothetical protein
LPPGENSSSGFQVSQLEQTLPETPFLLITAISVLLLQPKSAFQNFELRSSNFEVDMAPSTHLTVLKHTLTVRMSRAPWRHDPTRRQARRLHLDVIRRVGRRAVGGQHSPIVSRHDHKPDPEAGTNATPNLPQPLTLVQSDGSAVNHENGSSAILKPQQCLAKALSQLACMSDVAEALDLDPDRAQVRMPEDNIEAVITSENMYIRTAWFLTKRLPGRFRSITMNCVRRKAHVARINPEIRCESDDALPHLDFQGWFRVVRLGISRPRQPIPKQAPQFVGIFHRGYVRHLFGDKR